MKPILLLAIVGVAAAALATGSLNNNINLDVQQFGVGEDTIYSPVNTASVDFKIGQTTTNSLLYNVVDECYVTSSHQDLDAGSLVFCKLTNIDSNVVAEGHTVLVNDVDSNTPITIPIDNLAVDTPPFSNNVKNIHDVLVVIQAP